MLIARGKESKSDSFSSNEWNESHLNHENEILVEQYKRRVGKEAPLLKKKKVRSNEKNIYISRLGLMNIYIYILTANYLNDCHWE